MNLRCSTSAIVFVFLYCVIVVSNKHNKLKQKRSQNDVRFIVGRICNNFEKNRAFYDKSMKLGTWLVDNNTSKLRVSATPKMSFNGRHLVCVKMAAFLNLFIIMSFLICKHNVFFS